MPLTPVAIIDETDGLFELFVYDDGEAVTLELSLQPGDIFEMGGGLALQPGDIFEMGGGLAAVDGNGEVISANPYISTDSEK